MPGPALSPTHDRTKPVPSSYTLVPGYTVLAADVTRGFAFLKTAVIDLDQFLSHVLRGASQLSVEGAVTWLGNPATFRLASGSGYTLTAGDVWYVSAIGYAQ